jgi:hypothetical protein
MYIYYVQVCLETFVKFDKGSTSEGDLHTYIHIYTCIYNYINVLIHTYKFMYLNIYIDLLGNFRVVWSREYIWRRFINIYVYVYIYSHICAYTYFQCSCLYIYIYICIYIQICLETFVKSDKGSSSEGDLLEGQGQENETFSHKNNENRYICTYKL